MWVEDSRVKNKAGHQVPLWAKTTRLIGNEKKEPGMDVRKNVLFKGSDTYGLLQLLSSVIVLWKHPQIKYKWMSLATFQTNFIYRHWNLNVIQFSCITKLLLFFDYFQLFKNANTILNSWAIWKQMADQDLAWGL